MNKKNILIILTLIMMIATSCSKPAQKEEIEEQKVIPSIETEVASDAAPEHTLVTFEVENFGEFTVETYPEEAPDSVNHFLYLVESGYYNGFSIDKIDHSYAMFTSDTPLEFSTDSAADFNYTVPGEFLENGRSNDMPLEKYTLALYHESNRNDSAMAKFMIFLTDDHESDGKYAGFAKVVKGMDVVDKMSGSLVDHNDVPLSPIVMKKVYIND